MNHANCFFPRCLFTHVNVSSCLLSLFIWLNKALNCAWSLLLPHPGASWSVMTSGSFWSTSLSPKWSATPSMATWSPSLPCWRSRPRSTPTTRPRTLFYAGPKGCFLQRTSDKLYSTSIQFKHNAHAHIRTHTRTHTLLSGIGTAGLNIKIDVYKLYVLCHRPPFQIVVLFFNCR